MGCENIIENKDVSYICSKRKFYIEIKNKSYKIELRIICIELSIINIHVHVLCIYLYVR
jgi:hypothetical protein